MKYIIRITLFIFVLLLCGLTAWLQKPQKVYSVVKEIHPFEWYQEKALAWKKVLDANPSDGEAWLSFYTANRMMWLTEQERFMKLSGPAFKSPSDIAEMAAKAIPGSFEALYIKVWTSQDYPGHENDLLKAWELSKGSPDLLDEMCLYYEIKRDKKGRKEIDRQWLQSGEIPTGILNYNYNVLMTLSDDAIVFTGGDNDTFPLWVLQDAMGIKPGVKVMNISLMMKPDYRGKVLGELGIPDLKVNPGELNGKDSMFILQQNLMKHVMEKSGKPVFIALTLSSRYYSDEERKKDLYLDGLALRYDKKPYDNLGVIRRHFEKDYLLDYLKVNFRKDASSTVTDQINTGYLPALVKLCSHYRASGESSRLEEIRRLIAGCTAEYRNNEEFRAFGSQTECN